VLKIDVPVFMSLAVPSVHNHTLSLSLSLSVCECVCKIKEHTVIYLKSGVDSQFEGNAPSKLVSVTARFNVVSVDSALHVDILIHGDVEELNGH